MKPRISPAVCWFLVSFALGLRGQDLLPPPEDPPEPETRFALIVPANLQVAACGGRGVEVHYPAPRVRTGCATPAWVDCQPPSGAFFPLGETVVTCSVATACGERATRTFTVTVVADKAPPGMVCPGNLEVFAEDPAGTIVEYPLPSVRDEAEGGVRVEYDPPSGSRFPLGETRVSCTATDACGGRATCVFTVTVRPARLGIRPGLNPDPSGGPGRPVLVVTPEGFPGMEVAEALDGDWRPVPPDPWTEPLDVAPARFFRPPTQQGIKVGPQAEIAYVQVGLLAAYFNPGVHPARGIPDESNNLGTRLLSGTTGGTGGNLWSPPQNLPFTFHFFGRPHTSFRVSKHGLVTFSTNILNGREGLDYFEFPQGQTTNRVNHTLPLWNRGFAVDNTIFGLAGRYRTQDAEDGVWAWVHGTAPRRQVWIVFRHAKDVYGRTTTAVVLEETSNRILLMDMNTENPGNTSSWILAGIQGEPGSTREVRQVPASPNVRLVAANGGLADNGCYLFRPYALRGPVTGQAAPSLLSATNLDLLISEHVRQFNVPGLTVAISRHGRLIFNKGYGYANVELNQAMQPHHRACIGSVSKVLAAFGVEMLIQQKRLGGLQDWAYASNRLGKPWFWNGVNRAITNGIHANFGSTTVLGVLSNVTVRHLLSHTAALANVNDDAGAADAYAGGDYTQLTPQQQVQWFMATQPLLTNGVALLRSYSNPAFKQVGVLIEEVAGRAFEPWMMENILIPAGVPNARLMRVEEAEETWRDARRYHRYSGGNPWTRSRIDNVFGPRTYGDAIYANAADGGAGSWTATAADLLRLMAALDGFPNHPDILPPERFEELEQVAFPGASTTQAIGWDSLSDANSWVQKNGDIGYGSAQLVRSTEPDRLTVAVVANTGGVNVSQLARDLVGIVRQVNGVSPFYDLFPAQLGVRAP